MNKKLKLTTAILSAGLLVTPVSGLVNHYDNVAKAEQINKNNVFESEIDLSKIDVDQKLKEAEFLLNNKQITKDEFSIIKMILKPEDFTNQNYGFRSNYYPEQKIAYINHQGIKEIYDVSIPRAKNTNAILSFITGTLAGGPYGWGLGALGVIQSFGGKVEFEKAVEQAYWQAKGIDVYYQIHKGVMSLNRIRYVVI